MARFLGRIAGNTAEQELTVHLTVLRLETNGQQPAFENMQLEYVRGDKREKVDLHKQLLPGEQKIELYHTFVNKSKFFLVKDTK